jgi:hypothetical protein
MRLAEALAQGNPAVAPPPVGALAEALALALAGAPVQAAPAEPWTARRCT